jgi:hypothetical protein
MYIFVYAGMYVQVCACVYLRVYVQFYEVFKFMEGSTESLLGQQNKSSKLVLIRQLS